MSSGMTDVQDSLKTRPRLDSKAMNGEYRLEDMSFLYLASRREACHIIRLTSTLSRKHGNAHKRRIGLWEPVSIN